jgi:CBS domain-containing protein
VLKDAEAFAAVVQVVERIGRLVGADGHGLGDVKGAVVAVANASPLAMTVPSAHPTYHLRFARLFELVQESRNLAVHEGALARNLTARSIELALVLEDALMPNAKIAGDYMIRGPVTAEPWQPLSFIRQTMLAQSFSYLPVRFDLGPWEFVADYALAAYLGGEHRRDRLRETLLQAKVGGLQLLRAEAVDHAEPVVALRQRMDATPVLVTKDRDLLGILTAFDLL